MSFRAQRPNIYTGSALDRAVHLREDAGWIQTRLSDPSSLFVPLWRGKVLLAEGNARMEVEFLSGVTIPQAHHAWVFLGTHDDRAIFALEIEGEDSPSLPQIASGRFEELRPVASQLPADQAALLAHARAMMHWRARHRFCGVCGAACRPGSAGNKMICTDCETEHFPRTDPAVIMLVTRDDKVLLAHSLRHKGAIFSTLAGFVEPGESLEEAVTREVFEETGVHVDPADVYYHSSQPWPFPASIMLGFIATARSDDIVVDHTELEQARWFTRAEIADPAAHGFDLPPKDSIARHLIDSWMQA